MHLKLSYMLYIFLAKISWPKKKFKQQKTSINLKGISYTSPQTLTWKMSLFGQEICNDEISRIFSKLSKFSFKQA